MERVDAYQEQRLLDVDAENMAAQLREALLAGRREVLVEAGVDEAEIERTLASLEQMLGGIRLPDVAAETMGASILDPALVSIREDFADQPLVRARLLMGLGQIVAPLEVSVGEDLSAEALFAEALELRRRYLGDDHPDTLRSMLAVGETELVQQAYEGLRAQLGPGAPETIEAMFAARGPSLTDTFVAAEQYLGSDDLLTLRIQGQLGRQVANGGDVTEGMQMLRSNLRCGTTSVGCSTALANWTRRPPILRTQWAGVASTRGGWQNWRWF